MLEPHEKAMISRALKFYKTNSPTVNELDKVFLGNLKDKIEKNGGEKTKHTLSDNDGYHILNDLEIMDLCSEKEMIKPCLEQHEDGVISYGLGSFGYDIRISDSFEVFSPVSNATVDPKDFDTDALYHVEDEESVTIPPNSFVLGYSVGKFNMPENVMGICLGKSTYARCGIIVNMTPIEPGWRGHLTIEISNTTPLPAKVYSNEGIAQAIFFRGKEPHANYDDKKGKYQDQTDKVHPSQVV